METADGRLLFCIPVPAAFIADLQETASVLNLMAHPADYSDPNYLVHKSKLNSVREQFPPRTEKYHDQVSRGFTLNAAFDCSPLAACWRRVMMLRRSLPTCWRCGVPGRVPQLWFRSSSQPACGVLTRLVVPANLLLLHGSRVHCLAYFPDIGPASVTLLSRSCPR